MNNIVKKTKLINRKSCRHPIKTRTDASAGHTATDFETIKKHGTLSLSVMGGILIALFTIVGCSDVPYTGPILLPDDVDQYLASTDEDSICLYDGFDTYCLKLIPGARGERGPRGSRGEPGTDGDILILETPCLLLETESKSFVLMVSKEVPEGTPDIYTTPVATVKVPVGGGTLEINPIDAPVSVRPVPMEASGTDTDAPKIWHVRYKMDGTRILYHIYERSLLEDPTADLSDIPTDYAKEIQGTKNDIINIINNVLAWNSREKQKVKTALRRT